MKRTTATAALLSSALAVTQEPGAMIEWPYVGAGQAQTKYSAVDDITAANVDELEIVWRWEPNATPLEEFGTRPGPFPATPIMVGNVLFLSTMYNRVAALDVESGLSSGSSIPGRTKADPRVRGRGVSSTGASPGGATGTRLGSSSTVAIGSMRSTPGPVSSTRASARAEAFC